MRAVEAQVSMCAADYIAAGNPLPKHPLIKDFTYPTYEQCFNFCCSCDAVLSEQQCLACCSVGCANADGTYFARCKNDYPQRVIGLLATPTPPPTTGVVTSSPTVLVPAPTIPPTKVPLSCSEGQRQNGIGVPVYPELVQGIKPSLADCFVFCCSCSYNITKEQCTSCCAAGCGVVDLYTSTCADQYDILVDSRPAPTPAPVTPVTRACQTTSTKQPGSNVIVHPLVTQGQTPTFAQCYDFCCACDFSLTKQQCVGCCDTACQAFGQFSLACAKNFDQTVLPSPTPAPPPPTVTSNCSTTERARGIVFPIHPTVAATGGFVVFDACFNFCCKCDRNLLLSQCVSCCNTGCGKDYSDQCKIEYPKLTSCYAKSVCAANASCPGNCGSFPSLGCCAQTSESACRRQGAKNVTDVSQYDQNCYWGHPGSVFPVYPTPALPAPTNPPSPAAGPTMPVSPTPALPVPTPADGAPTFSNTLPPTQPGASCSVSQSGIAVPVHPKAKTGEQVSYQECFSYCCSCSTQISLSQCTTCCAVGCLALDGKFANTCSGQFVSLFGNRTGDNSTTITNASDFVFSATAKLERYPGYDAGTTPISGLITIAQTDSSVVTRSSDTCFRGCEASKTNCINLANLNYSVIVGCGQSHEACEFACRKEFPQISSNKPPSATDWCYSNCSATTSTCFTEASNQGLLACGQAADKCNQECSGSNSVSDNCYGRCSGNVATCFLNAGADSLKKLACKNGVASCNSNCQAAAAPTPAVNKIYLPGTLVVSFDMRGLPSLQTNGLHIHTGTTCEEASKVGAHYWNQTQSASDPWTAPQVKYTANYFGQAQGSFQISGAALGLSLQTLVGHAVVVHANVGGIVGQRIGCGILIADVVVSTNETKPSCLTDEGIPDIGAENCSCTPGGACNTGLVCKNQLCEKPPPVVSSAFLAFDTQYSPSVVFVLGACAALLV